MFSTQADHPADTHQVTNMTLARREHYVRLQSESSATPSCCACTLLDVQVLKAQSGYMFRTSLADPTT